MFSFIISLVSPSKTVGDIPQTPDEHVENENATNRAKRKRFNDDFSLQDENMHKNATKSDRLNENGAKILKQCQDSANNNENIESEQNEATNVEALTKDVTLEALEHTKVAVAQLAASTLAKGADEKSIKDLALLQSTLFTLQHQQVFQLQLIEQLQTQLTQSNFQKEKKRAKVNLPANKTKEDEQLPEQVEKQCQNAEAERIQAKW